MSRQILPALAFVLVAALPVSAQSVSLTLREGRVTLITQNATPAAILAEWARLGQVKVVDAERVPGTPLTLRLENVSEREALDIVLRGAAGYIAAPRSQAVAGNLSRFDRVLVMATSPGASASARPGGAQPAGRNAAVAPVQPIPAQVEEEAVQAQPAVVEEAPAAAGGAEQPASSTNFDYANPQRYFAARQAEQQAAEGAQQQPAQPSTSPIGTSQTTARPGVLPMPQPQGGAGNGTGTGANVTPYGLPAGQSPGSAATPSQLEPDRAKYINPYSPTPPRP